MKIRIKILSVFLVIAVIVVSAVYITTASIVANDIAQIERKETADAADRLQSNLNVELQKLISSVNDWAAWDETYGFMQSTSSNYISSNLMDETFTDLDINLMVFADDSRQMVFGKIVYANSTSTQIDQNTIITLLANSNLFPTNNEEVKSGLLIFQDMPLLVAAHPILTSFHEGPFHGTLIIGRFLDTEALDRISTQTGLPLAIYMLNGANLPDDVEVAHLKLTAQKPFFSHPLNQSSIAGYLLIADINDAPTLIAKLYCDRTANLQGNVSLTYTAAAFTIFGVITLFVVYFTIDKIVVSRLSRLSIAVKTVGESKSLTPVKVDGNDELSNLGNTINVMLGTIHAAQATLTQQAQTLELNVQKRTKELNENQEKLKSILDASPDAIVATDLAGNIVEANERMAKTCGVTRANLIGRSAMEFIPTQEIQKMCGEIQEKVIQNHETMRGDCIFLRGNGVSYPADLSVAAIKNSEGQATGFVAIIRDITEKKQIQKRLFDSERLAAIGATAGMVGHDIRNPLQAITSDIYLVRSDFDAVPEGEAKDRIKESLDAIEKNVDYINKIVLDLQDYARPLTPHREKADIQAVIKEVFMKETVPSKVKVKVTVEDGARFMVADPDYIKRILYNLVTNAVQAMPNGGELTINAFKQANDTILTVKDTGVGIPADLKEKLFTPMFTTKSKGQGFGLAVVKRMTEVLGGKVTFESQENQGTTFKLHFGSSKNDYGCNEVK